MILLKCNLHSYIYIFYNFLSLQMEDGGKYLVQGSSLIELAQTLRERFSGLTVKSCQLRNPSEDFLHIVPVSLDQSSLDYLPTFHVVICLTDQVGALDVRLLCFNGKLLESDQVTWTCNEDLSSWQHLERLNSGQLFLCQGIRKCDPGSGFESQKLVREFLDNEIVVRSQNCQYATLASDYGQCMFCREYEYSTKTISSEPKLMKIFLITKKLPRPEAQRKVNQLNGRVKRQT